MSQDTNQQDEDRAALWAQADADEASGTTRTIENETRIDNAAAAAANEVEAEDSNATQAAAAQTAATEAAVDRYAGLPQEFRDEFLGLKSMVDSLQQRQRESEGRIGGLRSQADHLKQQLEMAKSLGGDAPSAREIRAAQGSADAMAELKKEYPDFGELVDAAMNERLGGIQEQLKTVQQPQPSPAGVTKDELQAMRNAMKVEARYPGWEDQVREPAFHGWLVQQPREVQALAASESPQDAIRLLDLHSEARTRSTQNRNSRLSAAAAIPNGRSAPTARAKQTDQMSPEELWRHLDEQDRQNKD